MWHWAHDVPCTIVGEPETAWHRSLKEMFPAECREIVRGNHRADVLSGTVVYEFQRKPLEPSEYTERTHFWRRQGFTVRWVFYHADNPETFVKREQQGFSTFRWKWPKRRLATVETPFMLDLGLPEMFEVRRVYWGDVVGGWGKFVSFV